MKETNKIVADAIKKRREHLNMSQQELAEKCGSYQQAIARIESGKLDIKVSTLESIARAMNINVIKLIDL